MMIYKTSKNSIQVNGDDTIKQNCKIQMSYSIQIESQDKTQTVT